MDVYFTYVDWNRWARELCEQLTSPCSCWVIFLGPQYQVFSTLGMQRMCKETYTVTTVAGGGRGCVTQPVPLYASRRGNWITLKMKKLIKPKSRERIRSLTLTPTRSDSGEGFLGPLGPDSQDSSSMGSLDDTLSHKRSTSEYARLLLGRWVGGRWVGLVRRPPPTPILSKPRANEAPQWQGAERRRPGSLSLPLVTPLLYKVSCSRRPNTVCACFSSLHLEGKRGQIIHLQCPSNGMLKGSAGVGGPWAPASRHAIEPRLILPQCSVCIKRCNACPSQQNVQQLSASPWAVSPEPFT